MSANKPGSHLSPTLWRTCRVLANKRRLRVFRSLIDVEKLTVSEVAVANAIGDVSATQCLRALNARGLLRVQRVGRWVEYRIGHDPLVSGTEQLVAALRVPLRGKGNVIARTYKDVTAFTHPRRVLIVRLLHEHPDLTFAQLRALSGISPPALCRHLSKLRHRGLVDAEDDRFVYRKPTSPALKTLVQLART